MQLNCTEKSLSSLAAKSEGNRKRIEERGGGQEGGQTEGDE